MSKLNTYKLYYLASPYTHTDEDVLDRRYKAVTDATVALLRRGIYAFSPISYNHPMKEYDLPIVWEFWEPYDIAFLEKCDELLVLMLEGWDVSVGVAAEIKVAKDRNIPVTYLQPADLGVVEE